jgi:hypothetical protein
MPATVRRERPDTTSLRDDERMKALKKMKTRDG